MEAATAEETEVAARAAAAKAAAAKVVANQVCQQSARESKR